MITSQPNNFFLDHIYFFMPYVDIPLHLIHFYVDMPIHLITFFMVLFEMANIRQKL